jgi:WD40 repeat protein
MAPEQASGRNNAVDARTDVYALGAILYEMLTGRPPFKAATPLATLTQVITQEPVPPSRLQPGVPRDLETVCLKCLQKDSHRRFATALALADDLKHFQSGEPIQARPTPAWERAWKWAKRRPSVAALTAAVVLVAVTGLVLVGWQWRRAEGRRQRAEEAEAYLALRQGQTLCEEGDIGRGLLWMARSLERATSAGATNLDRPLRINLAEWARQLRPPGPRLPQPAPILGLTFDPSGRLLLAAGKDGFVHYWDVETAREVGPALERPLPAAGGWVGEVVVSPDGRTVATAGNGAVALWDLGTHQRRGAPLPHPPGMIWGLAFLPDGRLATCSDDGSARVWDLTTRQVVLGPLWHARQRGYYTLAVSPDGRMLVTAGDGRMALRWDLATGQAIQPPFEHDSPVMAAVFSRDGQRLFTSTRAGSLHAWDLQKARSTDLPRQAMETCALTVAPDGRLFASGNGFGIVRLWQTDSLRPFGPVYRCPAGVYGLAFSPDGRRLAMGMDPDGIVVMELPPPLEAGPSISLRAPTHAVCFTPDGSRLLAGTFRGARWLDPNTGEPQGEFLSNPENFEVDWTALSPDGKSLAMTRWSGVLGAWRGRAEVWDVATGQRRWQTPDLPEVLNAVAYSPDGRLLFTCGRPPENGSAGALWDVATGAQVRPLLAPLGSIRVRRAVFHPAGGRLLLGCDDGRARLWNVDTDAEVAPERLLGHAGAVTAVAFDRTGERCLTGCRDGTAHLWDVRTGLELTVPLRHEAEVSTVAFSPDGLTLLTGSLDGAVRFWDARSGQPLGPTRWHSGSVRAVTFRPDGQRVAVAADEGIVSQWQVPVPPVDGNPEQIQRWVETLSGLTLDEQGAVHESSGSNVAEQRLNGMKGRPAGP